MMPNGSDDRGSKMPSHRAPPPNYFSRGVQVKILIMVFLFMGVLMLMTEARKAKNWQWMWQFSEARSPGETVPGDAAAGSQGTANSAGADTRPPAEIDTRPPRTPEDGEGTGEPVITAAAPTSTVAQQGPDEPPPTTATAQRDGWNYVLRRLSKEQRQLLQSGMWSWRHQTELAEGDRARWDALVARLSDSWSDYHARAYLSVAEDNDQWTDSQQRTIVEIIEASKKLWTERRAALETLGQDLPARKGHDTVLTDLQRSLDHRAWEQVQDNAPLRDSETEAWYRCWDQLGSLTPEQQARATGPLSFVQLFSQPNEFRGRLIKVRGTARWGYRLNAVEPRFGVNSYVVLGLLPGDDSGSPIVVYCTTLPDGFPDVGKADQDGKGGPLDEDVEVTGYFFKRWLHRSAAGMNLSPLILGKVTRWQPAAGVDRGGERSSYPGWTMFLAILAMALFSVFVALWVYRSSSWSTAEVAASTPGRTVLPPFDVENVRDSVAETLRRFEDNENQL